MEGELSEKLLNEVEAHTNVLVKREQEINKKLVSTEFLVARYKVIHNVALLLLRINDMNEARKEFLNYLVVEMHFQKVLMIGVDASVEIYDNRGYEDSYINELASRGSLLSDKLGTYFESKSTEFDGVYVGDDSGAEAILGMSTFLVGRAIYKERKFYILSGYDSSRGDIYKAKYPLNKDDISWYIQIIVLWSSFLTRIRLFDEINKNASENLLLAKQREKQIEDRTRALLEALFDAKKFKLALELADAVVLLIDDATHKIIYANELFEKSTGYKRDKVVGKITIESLKLIPLDKSAYLFSMLFEVIMKKNNAFRGRYVFIAEDQSEKEFVISVSRFDEEGGGSLYVLIGRDVTSERDIIKKDKTYAEDILKLNQLIVNRELRIIELKQKIATLIK